MRRLAVPRTLIFLSARRERQNATCSSIDIAHFPFGGRFLWDVLFYGMSFRWEGRPEQLIFKILGNGQGNEDRP
jgi:hypothetical protein